MSQTPTENIPVFYVCITATSEGPPIEIAWAYLAFETYGVICESRLISPRVVLGAGSRSRRVASFRAFSLGPT
jgi:hypothetical protein